MDDKDPLSVQYPQLSGRQKHKRKLIIIEVVIVAASMYWFHSEGTKEAIIVAGISLRDLFVTLSS